MQPISQQYPNVYKLLSEGEIDSDELMANLIFAEITADDLPIMEQALIDFPKYQQGLPFPGEDADYDLLVKTNPGFALLQKFMDACDN